jgi:predicted nucleic-acid-binding protein
MVKQNKNLKKKRIEEVLNKLLAKRQVPITAHEIEMFDELKAIRKTHGDFDDEIKQVCVGFD